MFASEFLTFDHFKFISVKNKIIFCRNQDDSLSFLQRFPNNIHSLSLFPFYSVANHLECVAVAVKNSPLVLMDIGAGRYDDGRPSNLISDSSDDDNAMHNNDSYPIENNSQKTTTNRIEELDNLHVAANQDQQIFSRDNNNTNSGSNTHNSTNSGKITFTYHTKDQFDDVSSPFTTEFNLEGSHIYAGKFRTMIVSIKLIPTLSRFHEQSISNI